MFKTTKELLPDPDQLGLQLHVRGWNGQHPVFAQVVEEFKPIDIVEVGCWVGHGTLHLASLTPGKLYCVDTWLGGFDHLINSDKPDCQIPLRHGYPSLYDQWLFNVATSDYADRVIPIPQTSVNGARLLAHAGKTFGVIVIDASHEYEDTYQDLLHYSRILKTGGAMIADDFRSHPGVFHAVLRFSMEYGFEIREVSPFAVLTRKAQP